MNIAFISLGCSKNRVDTENMMADLQSRGHRIVNRLKQADAVVVNTCGFILEAKQETIESILETAELKKSGRLKLLIATGCLSQRYGPELFKELPEVDGFLGVGDIHRLPEVIDRCARGERVLDLPTIPSFYMESGQRLLTTPPGLAYLKITEGCDNRCNYCAIPLIRGPLRSRPVEDLAAESERLAAKGVKEIVLIGQDITVYGTDLDRAANNIWKLVERLDSIEGIQWIRLMYAHPLRVDQDFVRCFEIPKVVPYLDMPVQHASSRILQRMGRGYDRRHIEKTVEFLRKRVPGIALRTTLMTGFPGESKSDHRENISLLKELAFDWVGVFTYSREEGTPAAKMKNSVSTQTKEDRREELMALQREITFAKNKDRVGHSCTVLIEKRLKPGLYKGHAEFQAPEVDGYIKVHTGGQELKRGEFCRVKLVKSAGYDMVGQQIRVVK